MRGAIDRIQRGEEVYRGVAHPLCGLTRTADSLCSTDTALGSKAAGWNKRRAFDLLRRLSNRFRELFKPRKTYGLLYTCDCT